LRIKTTTEFSEFSLFPQGNDVSNAPGIQQQINCQRRRAFHLSAL
jgi:hypothetical protein